MAESQTNFGFLGNKTNQEKTSMKTPPKSWGKSQTLETEVTCVGYIFYVDFVKY